jgi:Peptidase family M48
VFWLAVALGSGGLGLTVATLIATLASVHHGSSGVGRFMLAGLQFTYPSVNGAGALLLALGMLGAGVITVSVRAARRQIRAYRRFTAALELVEPLARDPRVSVIRDPRPQAFCAGYLRPSVYVSRRTVELLADAELDAVLAHEHHHRRVRDPLRIACGRILGEALFFLPVLRPLCARYADVAELSADCAAVRATADRGAALASALLVFDDNAPPGVSGISPERVDSLLGQLTRWRLPALRLGTSVAVLPALSLGLWWISQHAAAEATFNLPILSSRPCVAIMSIVPLAGAVRTFARRLPASKPT